MGLSKYDIYRASQIDIYEFLLMNGFTPKKKGDEFYFAEIGDSFCVNREKNTFMWFSKDRGGGAIQCVEMVYNKSFEEAVYTLLNGNVQRFEPPKRKKTPKADVKFEEPIRIDNGWNRVYAYLVKTRRLSPEIVTEFRTKGLIFPTKSDQGFINTCFVHINAEGEHTGADIEGTHSSIRFKKEIKPNSNDAGFIYTIGEPQKAYIFEAPIDLMSFIDLHKNDPSISDSVFVSMAGLKHSIADRYIDSGMNVISCVDNDEPGNRFNERYKDKPNFTVNTECREKSCKDFNELCIQIKSEMDLNNQKMRIERYCTDAKKPNLSRQRSSYRGVR